MEYIKLLLLGPKYNLFLTQLKYFQTRPFKYRSTTPDDEGSDPISSLRNELGRGLMVTIEKCVHLCLFTFILE